MSAIEVNPSTIFSFPNSSNLGDPLAPLATAKRKSSTDEECVIRILVFTEDNPIDEPVLSVLNTPSSGQQLEISITYKPPTTFDPNEYRAWYLEKTLDVDTDVDEVLVNLTTSNRPPKTSRGTVIVIQPNS